MAEFPELRSPPEMRDYLVRELNSALRRPGMHGGEVSLRLVIDHLLHDRFLSEVLDAFGPPFVWLGGGNPHYGKTLGYVTEPADSPMVFFHLWKRD